jgi:hypothetical protein
MVTESEYVMGKRSDKARLKKALQSQGVTVTLSDTGEYVTFPVDHVLAYAKGGLESYVDIVATHGGSLDESEKRVAETFLLQALWEYMLQRRASADEFLEITNAWFPEVRGRYRELMYFYAEKMGLDVDNLVPE